MAKQSRCFRLNRTILMVACAIVLFFALLFGLIRYWYYSTGFYPYKIQFEHGYSSFTQLVTGAELAQTILDIDETGSISYTILIIWILIACIAFLYFNVFGGFTQAESASLEPSKPGLLSHEWTIEDFGDYLNGGKMSWKKKLNSKEFSTSDGSVEFYLSLYPNGNGVENKDHLSVSLHLTKESDVKFNCTFSLVDGYLRKHFKSVIDKALPKEGFGYPKFFSHSDLKKSANNYLSQNKLTIRVDIEDVDCKLFRGYHETRSTTSTNCHVHIWTIDNYSSLDTGYAWKWEWQEYIESNKFITSNRNLPEFYLRLYPNGDEDNDYISLYLMSCNKSEIVFNCTFAIFGNGVATITEFKHKFDDSNVGHPKFISQFGLRNSKNGYLPNDKLTIYCVISDQNEEFIRGCTVTRSTTTDSYFG